MQINNSEIKKILCIKPRGIGDIILSTIVLENLKTAFPHSEIHYLTEEFAKCAVENNQFTSKILTFKKNDFILSIIRKVRNEKYDIVFDLWSNPKTAQITFLSGAKYRVGYDKRGRRYAYNFLAKPGSMGKHAAEDNLTLLNALETPIKSKNIIFNTTDEEKSFAENFINNNLAKDKNFLVGIIPSGGWESKRCDAEKWVEICEEIQNHLSVQFIILWGPGDESDVNIIKEKLLPSPLIAPKTSFGQLSGLIEKCDLVITNDSGPMHAAAALGVPALGIFGPTDPSAHRPFSQKSDYVIKEDLFCIICNKLTCPYNHECMLDLDVLIVLKKSRKLLNEIN